MIIFQKNFNKEFDPISFYKQESAKSAIHKKMNEPNNAMGSIEGDGWRNGTPGVDVTQTQPKMGENGYNWANSGVIGNNSVFTQSVISANRQDAGLDPNSRGDVRGTGNVGKSALGKSREFLNEKYGAKPESVSSGSTYKFDEDALRKQFEAQGMKPEQINDAVAQSKASYEAELAARAVSSQTTVGIDKPAGENKPQNLPKPLAKPIKEVPIITEEPEVEDNTLLNQFQADRKAEAAKLRAETGIIRGKAQEYVDKGREKLGNLKETAAATWDKWSDSYGGGITGSLGTDAALAAGGLALAGGAYHLLKKRKAKKKAEKEALENRIKK